MSYATIDNKIFKIPDIASSLISYDKIKNILYWQESVKDNIREFMNDTLDKCDVLILFCSPNALKSKPIKDEWTAADTLEKPIIHVFMRKEHIPPLLTPRLGVEFDLFNFQKNIEQIYQVILKKVKN